VVGCRGAWVSSCERARFILAKIEERRCTALAAKAAKQRSVPDRFALVTQASWTHGRQRLRSSRTVYVRRHAICRYPWLVLHAAVFHSVIPLPTSPPLPPFLLSSLVPPHTENARSSRCPTGRHAASRHYHHACLPPGTLHARRLAPPQQRQQHQVRGGREGGQAMIFAMRASFWNPH